MNLTVPIYVEGRKPGNAPTVYIARPLFFQGPELRGESLDRLLAHLTHDLETMFSNLSGSGRHDSLASCTFNPRITQHRLDMRIELRDRTSRCRFLFVVFRQFGRRIAFTPGIPDVWFDVARKEILQDRATEVLTRHFRELERDRDEVFPEIQALSGTAFVTTLNLFVPIVERKVEKQKSKFLTIGDDTPMDGAEELRRVGRCLDRQYPDDLDRALLRETEVAELTRLLDSDERRPILLVGPSQVGKTTLVHEYVYRRTETRDKRRDRSNVWLLAPARLISGMSFVGQWENRLLAILNEARLRRHILYFDDLLGLFLAGQSASSSLNVAALLKPVMEKRRVRILGEITSESLRVLREKDRSFADLFHIMPVREPSEQETLQIAVSVQRQLEDIHRCRFDLDVLPIVLDLQRRYARGVSFPGKAAAFLKQLAVKFRSATISRTETLTEFQERSGLVVTFLDRQVKLSRSDVIGALSRHIVGQDAALQAAADVIAIAKARMNDPDRPPASFLFLGPTGVGKTQCAKALASFLFGSEERLLRFDLNEFGSPGSSTRLIGTFSQPEGLLTSAIRRQPFSVVLFDEVEKADPEVFDLLLQVLGEGRLTDALGRTADFTNALIILTSNLGVREAESNFGFRREDEEMDAHFHRAAENFFRPEFFNRIDRIIPFRRLTRDVVRGIARKLIENLLQREGLVQRKCLLAVETDALELLVERGFDPVLGARALKRTIERQLADSIAQQLASLPPGGFTVIRVYPAGERLHVCVQPLEETTKTTRPEVQFNKPDPLLRKARETLRRLEDEFAYLKPTGPLTLGQVPPEHVLYFKLREQTDKVKSALRDLEDQIEEQSLALRNLPSHHRPDLPRGHNYKIIRNLNAEFKKKILREMAASSDINDYLDELTARATYSSSDPHAPAMLDLLNQLALLQAMRDGLSEPAEQRVLLVLRGLNGGAAPTTHLIDNYLVLMELLQLHIDEVRDVDEEYRQQARFLVVQGIHALQLTRLEAGLHLFCSPHAPLTPIQVDIHRLDSPSPTAFIADLFDSRREWLRTQTHTASTDNHDPFPAGPVVRIYSDKSGFVDLRTGITAAPGWQRRDLHACLLTALPWPAELMES